MSIPDRYGDCPRCGSAWGYPGGDGRTYTHLIAVEVRGVYDGVAYWRCPYCPAAWHRFAVNDYRRDRLEQAIAQWPLEAQPWFLGAVA
ncbi:MAG: hypothetical protein AB7O78_01560 [Thermoleophilia bacterium]